MAVQAILLTLTGTRQKRSMYHFGILPFASPVWATADFYYQSFRKSFVVFPIYRAEATRNLLVDEFPVNAQ